MLEKILGACVAAKVFSDLFIMYQASGMETGEALVRAGSISLEARKYWATWIGGETIETKAKGQ